MFADFKKRLVATRTQGAYAFAEAQLSSGDLRGAATLFAQQARDVSGRGMAQQLALRGWTGVLGAATKIWQRQRELPQPELGEAVAGMVGASLADLPEPWRHYEAFRALVRALLEAESAVLPELAVVLVRLFPRDPRPAYALGRGYELQIQAGDASLASACIDAYTTALVAAKEAGTGAQWEAPLKVRIARLWGLAASSKEDGRRRALGLIESLDPSTLASLEVPYRLSAAEVALGSERSMVRLRALDALVDLALDMETRPAVVAIVGRYLQELGWLYYPTEVDRIRSVLATADSEGPGGQVGAVAAHLGLLEDLRRISEEAAVARAHLERLRESAVATGDAIGRVYYAQALRVAAGATLDKAAVASALSSRDVGGLDPRWVALAALLADAEPTVMHLRPLLLALTRPVAPSVHSLAALALALPRLLEYWNAWPELLDLQRDAVGRYLGGAPCPSFGFAALGLRLLAHGEEPLARAAGLRCLSTSEVREAGRDTLLRALAARELDCGEPQRAVGWLVGIKEKPAEWRSSHA